MRRSSSATAGMRHTALRAATLLLLLGSVLVTTFVMPASASDRTRPVVTSVIVSPAYFSPNADGRKDSTALRFWVSERSRVTARVYLASTGAVVRNLSWGRIVAAGRNSVTWDGKNGSGATVGDGRYVTRLWVRDMAANRAAAYPFSRYARVDTVKPSFPSVQAIPNPFSPNRVPDGRADTTLIKFTLSEAGYVNVVVTAGSHTRTFRNVPRPRGTSGIRWNGRDNARVLVDNGSYLVTAGYSDLAGNIAVVPERTTYVAVDTVAPVLSSVQLAPSVATPYSADGHDDTATIRYSVNENATLRYTIRNPTSAFLRGRSAVALVPGVHVTSWNAKQKVGNYWTVVPDGRYPISMSFTDRAGNRRWLSRSFVIHSYYLVAVDPGHGGRNGVYDSGAVGPTGLRESVVNFDIGYNRLRPLLNGMSTSTLGHPVRVLMTRDREYAPWMTLDKRSSMANARGANIFISIHANAAGITTARGTESYYRRRSAQSYKLAALVQQRVLSRTGLYNRGVMSAGFYVLSHTRMPAALHESAFISNPREERLLKSSSFRQKEALGIRDGIIAYFRLYP